MNHYADRLLDAIEKKQNPSVVGLDPRLEQVPSFIKEDMIEKHGRTFEAAAESFLVFNKRIIDSVKDIVPAVKPQIAFYEKYMEHGLRVFVETVKYARKKGLVVIEDGKRNDIGSTAQAYSQGHIGKVDMFGEPVSAIDVDCITVNPYLGIDGIKPFIDDVKAHGKGIFVLVKTSNPSAGDFQDLKINDKHMYEHVAGLVSKWNEDTIGSRGYGSVGAVVGATYPHEAVALRKLMPKSIFLVPGYGAQGGDASGVVPNFNPDGFGAIVNSSRGIIFAYQKGNYREEDFDKASQDAAQDMKDKINIALKEAGKRAW
ncbi:orotidine-5'-phosphate decarboxylase [Candidatus Woesearchaeota archaeon]|nr:orotidine-5'-phosphate decarboxylase [Candidatus Woesearchaeota archaeon]